MLFNGFSLIQLNKWIYKLISKWMSNIYLKVTIEKKWLRYPKLQLLKFKKILSLGQLRRVLTHADIRSFKHFVAT